MGYARLRAADTCGAGTMCFIAIQAAAFLAKAAAAVVVVAVDGGKTPVEGGRGATGMLVLVVSV